MSVAASDYTPREELANVITHGLGVALSVAGLAVMTTFAAMNGNAWHVVSVVIFGASLVLLYTASTLYHSCREPGSKRLLRKFDHAGMGLLIACTYTPFLLVSMRGPRGWILFAVVWGLGLAGVALKFWFTGRFRVVSTLIYIAMGWLVLLVLRPIMAALPLAGFWLLLAGGLTYTFGTVFYLWKRLPYHHAIWHLFVLAGSSCHFAAVFGYVVPRA